MDYRDRYNKWLNSNFLDEEDKKELESIKDNEKEVEERFYQDLTFGTGGIRGIRGIGPNKMNKYVIRKATQGLANYILKETTDGKERGVIIAHDCRIGSKEYSENTARVLAANGIKSFLYPSLRSTPELSFGVRYKNCIAGIVITASHNPKEYNGYKAYWSDGAQVVDPQASGIVSEVSNVQFEDIELMSLEEGIEKGLINILDESIDSAYLEAVKEQVLIKDIKGKENYKMVYTPLHGTGNRPVITLLRSLGYDVSEVKEQAEPDGTFPTVEYANPEEKAAFELGVKFADEIGAKLVLANDPDADRIGIAVKKEDGEWFYPNGNQMGLLLFQYILNNRKDIPSNAKVISTIVSTPMIDVMAEDKNVGVIKTLTGFKFIGEKIRQFENKEIDGTYLFGFEESYGYLIGTHARDKDAVVSTMVIAEMAAYYESIGSSIYKELNKLYDKYGYCLEGLKSVTLAGKDGSEKIKEILKVLRENVKEEFVGEKVKLIKDYELQKETNIETNEESVINLPKSDVLQFILEDGSYITARPSGTEPKIKFYFSVNDKSEQLAKEKLDLYIKRLSEFLNV